MLNKLGKILGKIKETIFQSTTQDDTLDTFTLQLEDEFIFGMTNGRKDFIVKRLQHRNKIIRGHNKILNFIEKRIYK